MPGDSPLAHRRSRRSRSRDRSPRQRDGNDSRKQTSRSGTRRSRSRGRRSQSRSRSASSLSSNERKSRRDRDDSGKSRRKSSRRSPSSSSSASEPRERRRKTEKSKKRQKKEEKRRREEEKRLRQQAKDKETPEERLKRKLAKKQKKQELFFGYTNDSNPFGDSSLSTQFVWKKKLDQEKSQGKGKTTKADLKQQREQLIQEIHKARKRREEREQEMEERERLKAEEQRLREAQLYGDWEAKEEEFHKEQAQKRSQARIQAGREKPIDIVAKNILLYRAGLRGEDDPTMDVEVTEPYKVLEGLPLSELDQLSEDIRTYMDVEGKDGEFYAYWKSLALLCADAIETETSRRQGSSAAGVHDRVLEDLHSTLEKKSMRELDSMFDDVQAQLERGELGRTPADEEYWNAALQAIRVQKAKKVLGKAHRALLLKRLQQLDARKASLPTRSDIAASATAAASASKSEDEWEEAEEGFEAPAAGGVSPARAVSPVLESAAAEEGFEILDEDEARQQLINQRLSALRAHQERATAAAVAAVEAAAGEAIDDSALAREMESREQARGLEDDEELLAESFVPYHETYTWQDKYRPRKPRYYNRIKTGYDWNPYNQTHYDHDNPPPKTVQGYKFNIFYPDLIDKTKTPTFFLEPTDNPDFCIIRFHAGPPYEDVAFKIVNREWLMGKRSGYKCQFEGGILQLYFNFKKARYRR